MNPRGRQDQLLVEELPGEFLIYDLTRNEAHCLNQAAAFVWQQCDGGTTIPEIAARLPGELGLPADEALVWLALDRLGRAGLLHDQPAPPAGQRLLGRRDLMRKLGLTGSLAMLLPVISTAKIPAADQTASNPSPCVPPDCKCKYRTPPEARDCCTQLEGVDNCKACCGAQFGRNGSQRNSLWLRECKISCESAASPSPSAT